jgi:UDP-N-acetylglucosamine 4-epimerase
VLWALREAVNQAYNIVVGERTSLNDLCAEIRRLLASRPGPHMVHSGLEVRHSLADVSKTRRLLGYEPTHRIGEGSKFAVRWYVANAQNLTVTA